MLTRNVARSITILLLFLACTGVASGGGPESHGATGAESGVVDESRRLPTDGLSSQRRDPLPDCACGVGMVHEESSDRGEEGTSQVNVASMVNELADVTDKVQGRRLPGTGEYRSMKNAQAVYTSKRSITAGKLSDIAAGAGLTLRYLQLGGYAFSRYHDKVPKKGLTNPLNKSLLVVGAREGDRETLERFDGYLADRDNRQMQEMLNAFQLPWVELYSSRFCYDKEVAGDEKHEAKMIAKVPAEKLKDVKAAKTRYIIYNQSRRKVCGGFMSELAAALAEHVGGVVVEHVRYIGAV